ncbi:MAG: MBL fold metallo-hydrolase [bacterium]
MKVIFWGTRGSIPAPGPDTVEFGGNTSCVEVITSDGASLILDSGTGIRQFGLDYLKRRGAPRTLHLLITHVHWDHIQGFPFFVPAYMPDFTIHVYSILDIRKMLSRQMSPPFFPITLGQMKAKRVYHRLSGGERFRVGSARISTIALPHTDPVCGFRISDGGRTVVYATDSEVPLGDAKTLIDFARGADLFLHDSQYTKDEYEAAKVGWGHSAFEDAAELAGKAKVKKLILFHHEPAHTDADIRRIERLAGKTFPKTTAAREGMVIKL